MEEYVFQPQRLVKSPKTSFSSPTSFKPGTPLQEYPDFQTLDEAIDYIEDETEGEVWQVQRYLKTNARDPGPRPVYTRNYGAVSLWFHADRDFQRGYGKITAGIAWTSVVDGETSAFPLMIKKDMYRGGILWNIEAIEALMDSLAEVTETDELLWEV